MIVWFVGRGRGHCPDACEPVGVFSTREKAIERCSDRCDFICPLTIDDPPATGATYAAVEYPLCPEPKPAETLESVAAG
jgi:hypothetical protein